MLDSLKHFFNKDAAEGYQKDDHRSAHDVRVAACALFVEMARIDEKFTPTETETILSILQEKYGLVREHADALLAEADQELEQSVDLWQFAKLINENYSIDEKMEIIEILWRMVFVDGKMDRYEHYLMNKVKNLLRLSHDQLIGVKLKVLHPS
ncbi:MAG: TerB family tellurite resistance protein [Desulfobacterales bacterium]|nr:MAG: TerB family tellurite resistance protein [Desulfobacterales bacterium]